MSDEIKIEQHIILHIKGFVVELTKNEAEQLRDALVKVLGGTYAREELNQKSNEDTDKIHDAFPSIVNKYPKVKPYAAPPGGPTPQWVYE